MTISTRKHMIATSHGILAVEESGHGEIPLVMIHGNSYSRGVFRHQLRSSLTANHRLIAFDLPGCGESSDAPDPGRTYTLQGSADAAIELLGKLGVTSAIVLGWSLGRQHRDRDDSTLCGATRAHDHRNAANRSRRDRAGGQIHANAGSGRQGEVIASRGGRLCSGDGRKVGRTVHVRSRGARRWAFSHNGFCHVRLKPRTHSTPDRREQCDTNRSRQRRR
jgi:hypothetical protein